MCGIDIMRFAKGYGNNNNYTYKKGYSRTKGRNWKFKKQHAYKDYDKDGKVNRYDCEPLNPHKQDLRIAPSEVKDSMANRTLLAEDINIASKADETDESIERQIPYIIAHEEMHKALGRHIGIEAESTLDNINEPTNERPDRIIGSRKQTEMQANRIEEKAKRQGYIITDEARKRLREIIEKEKRPITREREGHREILKSIENLNTQLIDKYHDNLRKIRSSNLTEKGRKKAYKEEIEKFISAKKTWDNAPADVITSLFKKDSNTGNIRIRGRGRPPLTKEEMLRKGYTWEDIQRWEEEKRKKELERAAKVGLHKKKMKLKPEEKYTIELENTLQQLIQAEKENNKKLQKILKKRIEAMKTIQPHQYKGD